ncbi:glycosyltransferase [Actinomyces succiniciruminis]|uniref:glycosyltransferase n=1 Tax=Actinomyces succiniciruminis TaxID=1522002 RepID=UPI001B33E85D|nr:glycosyltransferase [Actinomyces succiniciruminis]
MREGSTEVRTDESDPTIRRYYRSGEYVAFEKLDAEELRPVFVDLLASGKRYRRLRYSDEGEVCQVQSFDDSNELEAEEYFNDSGVRYLLVEHRDGAPARWVYLDAELREVVFASMSEMLTYWLVNFNGDVLRDHVLISEWAFRRPALDRAAALLNFKVVYTFHNSHLGGSRRYSRSEFKPELRSTLEALGTMDAVVVLTNEQKYDLLKMNPALDNVHVIPHVVESEVAAETVERDPFKVAIISRLSPEKGIVNVVKEFGRILASVPDARLDIWGRGPEEESIRAAITSSGLSGNVSLKGFSDTPRREYAASAVALFPSEYEGQPLSLMECVMSGCVPVAYDFKYGARYAIEDGVSGFIVDPGNVDELIDAVRLLLVHNDLRECMSVAGPRRLADSNTVERLRKDWLALFLSLGGKLGRIGSRP